VATRLRRVLRRVLLETRFPLRGPILRLGLRVYELDLSLRARLRGGEVPGKGPDGWPVPPPALRAKVSWPADAGYFLVRGRAQAEFIRGLVARNGAPVEEMQAVLDFGCGCGRLARWWADARDPEIHGCDYNGKLVAWCASNLPFMRAAVNGLEPPLSYEPDRFDLVYALSVFTHLSEELQDRWLGELRRVLRPGGLLFFTVSGDVFAAKLSAEDRAGYDSATLITHFTDVEGSNVCAAYHPPGYVRTHMMSGLELVDEVPGGSRAAGGVLGQDSYLAKKPFPRRAPRGRPPFMAAEGAKPPCPPSQGFR
jgi:SAM-dependent methyltransferase